MEADIEPILSYNHCNLEEQCPPGIVHCLLSTRILSLYREAQAHNWAHISHLASVSVGKRRTPTTRPKTLLSQTIAKYNESGAYHCQCGTSKQIQDCFSRLHAGSELWECQAAHARRYKVLKQEYRTIRANCTCAFEQQLIIHI